MRKAVIIVGMIAAVLACSESKKDRFIVTEPLYTVSVDMPDTVFLGQEITYTTHASLGNSCLHYSHLIQSVEGDKIIVTLYMNWDIRDKVCFDVITRVDANGTFRPNAPGTYTFCFWRTEGGYLRRDVVVR